MVFYIPSSITFRSSGMCSPRSLIPFIVSSHSFIPSKRYLSAYRPTTKSSTVNPFTRSDDKEIIFNPHPVVKKLHLNLVLWGPRGQNKKQLMEDSSMYSVHAHNKEIEDTQ